jgi:hypothetical protein
VRFELRCCMRIVTTYARIFCLGVGMATSANASFFQPLVAQADPYSAFVSPTEARVVFSVPVVAEWEWCRPETGNPDLEYRWTATVQNGEQVYTFGFYLFKCLRSGPTRGTFDTLLRAGQMGVAEVVPGVGGRFLPDAQVGAETSTTQLTLVVKDAKTLRLLFSERPLHVTLRMQRPGEPEMIRDVPIIYKQP